MLFVTYGCHPDDTEADPVLSHEHNEIALIPVAEVGGVRMAEGYQLSISTRAARLHTPTRWPRLGGRNRGSEPATARSPESRWARSCAARRSAIGLAGTAPTHPAVLRGEG
ncbi:hypothetical protein UA74_13765 [Actinoalloteichus fjordicus]|uniref:Uncharacterized protein n=1 Tax=Actinoalloteichus fjordicus TaxID=1612552 RepID=A0AAC9PSG3_9PSEU|nr:hypothetical protein UA74_13765 [Actinoalloteichus fjordicus]